MKTREDVLQHTHDQVIADDYQACFRMARSHYENFPVISHWLPRRIRPAVAAIYAFARSADDLADEGGDTADVRLRKLACYREYLHCLERGDHVAAPGFPALADTIRRHRLPMQPFYDLLSAFSQDVTEKRYEIFDEVQDYCRRSADPVGILMLHLHGFATQQNIYYSGKICSALQWINFLQDIEQDYHEMQRIYIPAEDMRKFGVTVTHFQRNISDQNMSMLILMQIKRTRKMLLTGLPLEKNLSGRFKWIIGATLRCGMKVLDHLEVAAMQNDLFKRPRLSKMTFLFAGISVPYKTLEKMRMDILGETQ